MSTATRLTLARWLTLISGVLTIITALALVFAPVWFFETIGPFAPFNRHYEGDLGMFLLGIGVGLVFAWKDVRRHRLMIGAAALGNGLHVLNHAYDAILRDADFAYWLRDGGPVILAAIMLILAWVWSAPEKS